MSDDPVAAELAAVRDLIAERDELVARMDTAAVPVQEFNASQDRLAARAPRLLAAVEAALGGHHRSLLPATSGEHRGKHYCLDCTASIDHQTAYAVWPCARYAAIARELTRKDGGGETQLDRPQRLGGCRG